MTKQHFSEVCYSRKYMEFLISLPTEVFNMFCKCDLTTPNSPSELLLARLLLALVILLLENSKINDIYLH